MELSEFFIFCWHIVNLVISSTVSSSVLLGMAPPLSLLRSLWPPLGKKWYGVEGYWSISLLISPLAIKSEIVDVVFVGVAVVVSFFCKHIRNVGVKFSFTLHLNYRLSWKSISGKLVPRFKE